MPVLTIWDMLTAYVPAPPGVPVSCDVIMVPAVTPEPVRIMPGEKAPEAIPRTVTVLPAQVDVAKVTAVARESLAMVPVNVVAVTVWDMLTAYVPAPPVGPESCDVITVLAATVPPVMTMPGTKVPALIVPTVKVVPEKEDPVAVVVAVAPVVMMEAVLVAPEFAHTAPVTTALVAIAETGPDVDAAPWLTM